MMKMSLLQMEWENMRLWPLLKNLFENEEAAPGHEVCHMFFYSNSNGSRWSLMTKIIQGQFE